MGSEMCIRDRVGGLAVHYLTKRGTDDLPGAVTMDVDFGIALGAEGGQYGTIKSDLRGLGFTPDKDEPNRMVRKIENLNLYVDFLTESPRGTSGAQVVDDVLASVVPGINRALATRRTVQVRGKDVYGSDQDCSIRISEIGPLLVLKLNAYGGPTGRHQPKDAYDVLLLVTSYIEGAQAAVEAFRAEGQLGNSGYASAVAALKNHFLEPNAEGPTRAAEFLRGSIDDTQRVREDLVTAAHFMLGE